MLGTVANRGRGRKRHPGCYINGVLLVSSSMTVERTTKPSYLVTAAMITESSDRKLVEMRCHLSIALHMLKSCTLWEAIKFCQSEDTLNTIRNARTHIFRIFHHNQSTRRSIRSHWHSCEQGQTLRKSRRPIARWPLQGHTQGNPLQETSRRKAAIDGFSVTLTTVPCIGSSTGCKASRHQLRRT